MRNKARTEGISRKNRTQGTPRPNEKMRQGHKNYKILYWWFCTYFMEPVIAVLSRHAINYARLPHHWTRHLLWLSMRTLVTSCTTTRIEDVQDFSEGCNGVPGFDWDLLVHYMKIKEAEYAKWTKLQNKTSWNGGVEAFQLLNSLPMDGGGAQTVVEEDLEEECFSD